MGITYNISDGSFFGSSYTCSDVRQPCDRSWNDSVGSRLSKEANATVNRFNPAHAAVWERMSPLLDIREDAITYNSQAYEIKGLWMDE